MTQDSAFQVVAELPLHEARQPVPVAPRARLGEEGLQVLPHHLMQGRSFGAAADVGCPGLSDRMGAVVGRFQWVSTDVVAGSAVVYDWGPRTAELPLPISAYLARRSAEEALPARDASGGDVVESDS